MQRPSSGASPKVPSQEPSAEIFPTPLSDYADSSYQVSASRVTKAQTVSRLSLFRTLRTMATSSYPSLAVRPPVTQLYLHVALKMAQVTSMIVPPVYVVSALFLKRGGPLSILRLARVTAGSVIAAGGIGAVAGWARLRNEPDEAIVDRVERMVRPLPSKSLVASLMGCRKATPGRLGRMIIP